MDDDCMVIAMEALIVTEKWQLLYIPVELITGMLPNTFPSLKIEVVDFIILSPAAMVHNKLASHQFSHRDWH